VAAVDERVRDLRREANRYSLGPESLLDSGAGIRPVDAGFTVEGGLRPPLDLGDPGITVAALDIRLEARQQFRGDAGALGFRTAFWAAAVTFHGERRSRFRPPARTQGRSDLEF
jgi:hypothetical protein